MTELVWLVPVLRRPHNVWGLLGAICRSTPEAHVLFIADPDDQEELDAIGAAQGEFHLSIDLIAPGGSYAAKINRGIRATDEPLIFVGADDLYPRPGWFEKARAEIPPAEVVGINDLIPRDRDHQTHFLVTRAYAEQGQIDGEAGLLCERYDHCCVDDELIATAQRRGVYAYASDAIVRHLHPMVGAPNDAVYEKGMSTLRRDRRLFHQRAPLWT